MCRAVSIHHRQDQTAEVRNVVCQKTRRRLFFDKIYLIKLPGGKQMQIIPTVSTENGKGMSDLFSDLSIAPTINPQIKETKESLDHSPQRFKKPEP